MLRDIVSGSIFLIPFSEVILTSVYSGKCFNYNIFNGLRIDSPKSIQKCSHPVYIFIDTVGLDDIFLFYNIFTRRKLFFAVVWYNFTRSVFISELPAFYHALGGTLYVL